MSELNHNRSRDLEGVAKGENKGVVGWLMCNLALYQPNILQKCWADRARGYTSANLRILHFFISYPFATPSNSREVGLWFARSRH